MNFGSKTLDTSGRNRIIIIISDQKNLTNVDETCLFRSLRRNSKVLADFEHVARNIQHGLAIKLVPSYEQTVDEIVIAAEVHVQ